MTEDNSLAVYFTSPHAFVVYYDEINIPSYSVTSPTATSGVWKKYDILHTFNGVEFELKIEDSDSNTASGSSGVSTFYEAKTSVIISIGGVRTIPEGISRAFHGYIKEFRWHL